MTIEQLKTKIPPYAKDIKLNFSTLISNTESLPLSEKQIAAFALTASYTTQQKNVIAALESHAHQKQLNHQEKEAIKGAVSIMAMNNVYYRSVNQVQDGSYTTLPANLRMHILQQHGVDQKDFELYCLIVSAINACGRCVDTHVLALEKGGVSKNVIQYSIKIAAVIKAIAQVIAIEDLS